jgi:carbon monoxide dehydrogenase subunit G
MSTSLPEFGGEERFAAPPERLFGLLTDLDTLAASIPDLISAERPDARTLKCVVRPGFSFLRGTLKLSIEVGDLQPVSAATMRISAQGIGVALRLSSSFEISDADGGSLLKWQARIDQMTGLISTISPALVRAAAEQTVRHAWQQVRSRLGE